MNTLLVQSFGSENEYRRAVFAVLSFFAHCKNPAQYFGVVLYTDKPVFFHAFLKHLPVEYKELTAQRIMEMKGPLNFVHRMKIHIIKETFVRFGGNILYVDSDSFFTSDPNEVVLNLNESKVFMHKHEYLFQSMRQMPLPGGQPFVTFYEEVVNRTFDLKSGRSYFVDERLSSWNAGVIIMHRSYECYLEDVLELTDEFYSKTQCHACEQYAFSLVFQRSGSVRSCEEINYHYWYRTQKQVVDLMLANLLGEKWATQDISSKLHQVKHCTHTFPGLIASHTITVKDQAIQAFNRNEWKTGYRNALVALKQNPFDIDFLRDTLYHTRRYFLQ